MKLPSGPLLILNQSDSSTRAVWSHEGMTRRIIGFTTNEIEQLQRNLRESGITVTDIRDEGMGWFFEFLDPDGNMFSVLKYNHL
ncbi:VOC family protein [Paenibacillus sp. FSL H7-0331]|uniref:VOC family protein n=1 Tax=Paenibacillus sp. FSL H7-0331 TaxID=1920421 RepID=UPI00096D860A|nr:VOC family protein [Paenibacillus sp. FSL H7-0331]OME91166.1 hypothetical protein BK127_42155 [Paenibacillus sp. FSL H7-0331]